MLQTIWPLSNNYIVISASYADRVKTRDNIAVRAVPRGKVDGENANLRREQRRVIDRKSYFAAQPAIRLLTTVSKKFLKVRTFL